MDDTDNHSDHDHDEDGHDDWEYDPDEYDQMTDEDYEAMAELEFMES